MHLPLFLEGNIGYMGFWRGRLGQFYAFESPFLWYACRHRSVSSLLPTVYFKVSLLYTFGSVQDDTLSSGRRGIVWCLQFGYILLRRWVGFSFRFLRHCFFCGLLVGLCLVFAISDGTGNRIGLDWFPD